MAEAADVVVVVIEDALVAVLRRGRRGQEGRAGKLVCGEGTKPAAECSCRGLARKVAYKQAPAKRGPPPICPLSCGPHQPPTWSHTCACPLEQQYHMLPNTCLNSHCRRGVEGSEHKCKERGPMDAMQGWMDEDAEEEMRRHISGIPACCMGCRGRAGQASSAPAPSVPDSTLHGPPAATAV